MIEVGRHIRDKHDGEVEGSIEIEVIENEKDEFVRKMKEAIHIEREKPALNVMKGLGYIGVKWF